MEDEPTNAEAARARLSAVINNADKTLVNIDQVLRDVAEAVKSERDEEEV